MEFDVKEYNSVVLGALLHDVGKLLHRGNDDYKYSDSHEAASAKFINKFLRILKNDNLYDIELIRMLVQYHDTKIKKETTLNDPYFLDRSEEQRKRLWKLITVVRRADSYSCAERDTENAWANRTLPLDSIFSYINLNSKEALEENSCKYNLNQFNPKACFPKPVDNLTAPEILEIIKQFENSIPDFSRFKNFDDVLNKWLNLIEEYMWSVPSDTRYKTGVSDISLYDHLRSSAAIAACLYKRHIAAIEELKSMSRTEEFILIGGDFSGIQDYIFDITNRGSGGASKRLRARSFFIYLFSEVTIHKILHALDLPIVCNLFSTGGKFLLLAPNIKGADNILQRVKTEIEEEIHKTYFNQFSFLMSWMPIEGFREEFKVYSFFKTAEEMFYKLETEKIHKSQNVLAVAQEKKWNPEAFKATEMYEAYQGNSDCKICGKGPATYEEKDKDEQGRPVKCCFICYRDKLFIGQQLPKCNYIAFGKGNVTKEEEDEGKKIVIFHNEKDGGVEKKDHYYVELLEDYRDKEEYYLIYDIGNGSEKADLTRSIPIKKYYANHIPVDDNKKVLSFEEIAMLSRWKKDDKVYGSDLLGVLKADVDNLGLIFSKGFENPSRVEAELPDIDRKTVSRFLTLSRMFELFFTGWIGEVMSLAYKDKVTEELLRIDGIEKESFKDYLGGEQIDFGNIYTVYSGGDDLVLVGPWETMIIFSVYLNQQFRKYTCNNKFITLSAGLTFVKPKHPIASAIKQADELLNKSKKRRKNRVTLFGTTVKWEKIPELINFFLFLNEKLNVENPIIKPAFLHRILEYHRMALRFLDKGNIEGLKYISNLSYDIARNIIKREADGRIKDGKEEYITLQKLIGNKPDKKSLIYNVKIPVYWALYRNRKNL
ncbi:hypothetical protein BMS3Abin08_00298 [bacterium BMS3Abin08]|nr:hypothetical protein BMS3Abin08_00298 [bacterium BMS3Abin08]